MPFKSKAQARWMFANKPEMAKQWAKETKKDISDLPKRLGKRKRKVSSPNSVTGSRG